MTYATICQTEGRPFVAGLTDDPAWTPPDGASGIWLLAPQQGTVMDDGYVPLNTPGIIFIDRREVWEKCLPFAVLDKKTRSYRTQRGWSGEPIYYRRGDALSIAQRACQLVGARNLDRVDDIVLLRRDGVEEEFTGLTVAPYMA